MKQNTDKKEEDPYKSDLKNRKAPRPPNYNGHLVHAIVTFKAISAQR